jgi:hypothetical protein
MNYGECTGTYCMAHILRALSNCARSSRKNEEPLVLAIEELTLWQERKIRQILVREVNHDTDRHMWHLEGDEGALNRSGEEEGNQSQRRILEIGSI